MKTLYPLSILQLTDLLTLASEAHHTFEQSEQVLRNDPSWVDSSWQAWYAGWIMAKLSQESGQMTNLQPADKRPYVDLTQYAVMTPPDGNGPAMNTLQDIYAGVYKAPQATIPHTLGQPIDPGVSALSKALNATEESFPCWKDAIATLATTSLKAKDYDSDGSEGESYRDEVDILADPYTSAQYFTGSDLSR